MGSRMLLIINVLLIAIYLLIASRKDPVGKQSVLYQIRGGISPRYSGPGSDYLGHYYSGLVIAVIRYVVGRCGSAGLLITGTICEIHWRYVMLRYCVLKSAIYNPIISFKDFKRSQV